MFLFHKLFHFIKLLCVLQLFTFSDFSRYQGVVDAYLPSSQHPKRFEYTYSFKGPYLAQPDGSIPFWERRGNALPHDSNIRITPSLRNQRGSVWTNHRVTFDDWEVEFMYRISGRGRSGGEGLTFWYVEEKPDAENGGGGGFSLNEGWKGLAFLWRPYDKDGNFNNPVVEARQNNGSQSQRDDADSQILSSCRKDFRNKLFYTRVKITYHQRILGLYMTNGLTKESSDVELEPCFYAFNLTSIPSQGYFGISAATGGNWVDDHDVSKFLVYSFIPLEGEGEAKEKGEADDMDDKYDKEFKQYQEQTDKAREEYKLLHPDEDKQRSSSYHDPEDDIDPEDEWGREVELILKEQSGTRIDLHQIETNLEDILGKHESISAQVVKYQQGQGQGQVGGNISTIQRFEVENLLTGSRQLLSIIADIKQTASFLDKKLEETETKQQQQSADFPGVPSHATSIQQAASEVETLQSGIRSIFLKLAEKPYSSPETCDSCISTKTFILLNACLTALFLAGMIYKDYLSENSNSSSGQRQRFF